MNNFVTSLIRTYVPIAVGALISYLAVRGITLDANAVAGLVTFFTALLQALYYLAARLLEKKVPKLSILLGSSAQPVYRQRG